MFQVQRPDVSVEFDGQNVVVRTRTQQISLVLTNEELIKLTAELYDLDPAPLLCGTTPETVCPPMCCGGNRG